MRHIPYENLEGLRARIALYEREIASGNGGRQFRKRLKRLRQYAGEQERKIAKRRKDDTFMQVVLE